MDNPILTFFRSKKWPPVRLDVLCLTLSVLLLLVVMTGSGRAALAQGGLGESIADLFARNMLNQLTAIVEEDIPIARIYTLDDRSLVAPEPDQRRYGQVSSAADMAGVLKRAEAVLQGQATLFTTDTQILEGSKINYYLDDSIFAVTWKQPFGQSVYTFSEVKIAHASQFRRFFSEGVYGSDIQHTTTEMATSVNAVVASAADFYSYRKFGFVVNNGQIYRDYPGILETCYIDDQGDMLFTEREEIMDPKILEQFIEDNHIRFTISFGPILIEDGALRPLGYYRVGQIHEPYARAALCQLGQLHYAVVAANYEEPYDGYPTLPQFARNLYDLGITTAYALDGGQTATIVMNDTLINQVSHGSERKISDIIYFATAIPEENQ